MDYTFGLKQQESDHLETNFYERNFRFENHKVIQFIPHRACRNYKILKYK